MASASAAAAARSSAANLPPAAACSAAAASPAAASNAANDRAAVRAPGSASASGGSSAAHSDSPFPRGVNALSTPVVAPAVLWRRDGLLDPASLCCPLFAGPIRKLCFARSPQRSPNPVQGVVATMVLLAAVWMSHSALITAHLAPPLLRVLAACFICPFVLSNLLSSHDRHLLSLLACVLRHANR